MRNLSNLYVDGVVGIGTTSANAKLDVVVSSTYGGITVRGNIVPRVVFNSSNDASNYWGIGIHDNLASQFAIGKNTSGHAAMTEYFVISGSGDVGIGTNSPTSKTHVYYGGGTTNGLHVQASANRGKIAVSDNDTAAYMIAENSLASFGRQDALSANNLNITNGGNVLIGTTTDSGAKLNVVGGSGGSDALLSANSRIGIYGDGTLKWGASADYGKLTWDVSKAVVRGESGKALSLGANGTQDTIYIDTSQNVGIGTTSPSTLLHLAGSSAVATIQDNNSTGNTASAKILFTDNGTFGTIGTVGFDGNDILQITNSHTGKILLSNTVGVNTASPAHTLDVNGGAAADYFQLDTTATPTPAQGMFYWDADEETAGLQVNGLNYELGQGLYWVAKNQTGSQINKGTAVYASGTLGSSTRLLISPMIADGTIEAKYFLGIAAEDIADGTDGKVITQGKLRQLDTTGYGAAGNVLWVSASTAGQLTHTKPTGTSDIALAVAFVVDYASNGSVAVRVSNLDENIVGVISTLDQVTTAGNTTTNGITVGTINGTGNATITNGHLQLSDTYKLQWGGTNARIDGSNASDYLRFWTSDIERMRITSTGAVGIGTSSPGSPLHIAGSGLDTSAGAVGVHLGVHSSTYAGIEMVASGGADGWIDFSNTNSANDFNERIRGGSGLFQFYTSGSEKMRITSGGNILIGTTTDGGEKLQVSGTARIEGDLSFSSQVGTWITSSAMADAIGWNPSYGVYIGSNVGGTHYLRGNGTFTTGGSTYNLWHSGNDGSGSGLDADLLDGQQGSYYAPIASPALSGVPTAPTAAAGTNTTQIATTAFVGTAVSNLVDSAPSTLDTLNELAAALGDDPNFATTVTNSIAGKVAKSGDTMTGQLTLPNAVFTGTSESATVLRLDGGSTSYEYHLGRAGSTRTWSGKEAFVMHTDSAKSIAFFSSGWVKLLEVEGTSGNTRIAGTLTVGGGITASGYNNSNWDTAYGWGDHGTAGYALSTDLANYMPLSGGTFSGPVVINGSLTVNGTITESSSIKIKENVVEIGGNLEKVNKLKPVSYNKIGSEKTELGLIAEEVQDVYPEFVKYDEDGEPVGISYSRLTVALIGAVKELTKEIEELKNKING